MRLTILLLNQGRGSGEVARQQARHLVDQGHTVHFLHPRIGQGVEGAHNVDVDLGDRSTPVHEYLPSAGEEQTAVSTMGLQEAEAYLPAYESALESVAAETDLFIGHHANLTAIATASVARRHGKPYVLFLHGTGIEPRHHGGYDDLLWAQIEDAIRGARGILCTTDYVRDELIRPIVPLPVDRFLVQPCGVDLVDFDPSNRGQVIARYGLESRYVICPGALMKAKGPQNVVAASEIYHPLAQTVFIGAGQMQAQLERDLSGRGVFLGFVPSEDKAQLINSATLLVAAPEKKEHFGIIYAEALAGAVPSVAYEGGGVGSIVTPEVGVLTERTPEALGQAVRELLEDEPRRTKLSAASRPQAEARFSYPDLVAELVKWLEGVS